MTYSYQCRHFSGYKPCRFKTACEGCPSEDLVASRILIISLEAMGAVLRSTCLLPAIKRKYENSHITWITLSASRDLLAENPYIDRLLLLNSQTLAVLGHLEFDVLFAVDKSIEAGALAETVKAKQKFGFGLTKDGVIRPLTQEAKYQYDVGLNDELKFFVNQKPETQQITESMGLKWERDPYILALRPDELAKAEGWRAELNEKINSPIAGFIGYNTGCSVLFPYKKFTVARGIEVIDMWRKSFPDHVVLLLGGREDTARQDEMKAAFSDDPFVVNTPSTGGLRSGILWMHLADIVLSGCSLGMHIAIALQKQVIAWFGVSCLQEVDLYERGVQLKAEVNCTPCWKKSCEMEKKCYDAVSVQNIEAATKELFLNNRQGGAS